MVLSPKCAKCAIRHCPNPACLPSSFQLRQLDAWYREETDRWSSEREELCRKCCQLEQRHTQWQHELRRRDAEFERLQKHLATQITAAERRRRISSGSGGSSSSNPSSSIAMVLTSAGAGSSKHGRYGCLAVTLDRVHCVLWYGYVGLGFMLQLLHTLHLQQQAGACSKAARLRALPASCIHHPRPSSSCAEGHKLYKQTQLWTPECSH